eukprot:TRINITY_DN12598_c0_g1_i1.p1 TRINITY_DN12598_c0_g1~~TRINITY_DN12598_c0_g1_i1.p1  ORF type:complete len:139 (-),score=15.30 TRINITY_DN12598_c0_g1_i1:67-483(-)
MENMILLDSIITSHNVNISIGDYLYKVSETSATKELHIKLSPTSFVLQGIINGCKRRGNICTMFISIDLSSHNKINNFSSHISSVINIPNLENSSFSSLENEDEYIIAVRVPINQLGYIWREVLINCDDDKFKGPVTE